MALLSFSFLPCNSIKQFLAFTLKSFGMMIDVQIDGGMKTQYLPDQTANYIFEF